LRPIPDWQGTLFGKLQALPKDAKPITTWQNRDAAFVNVVEGIRQIVEEVPKSPQVVRREEVSRLDSKAVTNLLVSLHNALKVHMPALKPPTVCRTDRQKKDFRVFSMVQ
jgi:hypothetical protein